jgi:hypothetical protein
MFSSLPGLFEDIDPGPHAGSRSQLDVLERIVEKLPADRNQVEVVPEEQSGIELAEVPIDVELTVGVRHGSIVADRFERVAIFTRQTPLRGERTLLSAIR